MDRSAIAQLRLRNQHLSAAPLASAADVVSDLLAMQAQELLVARWSIGQRSTGVDDAAVGRAFDEGAFVRTHVLRPTWHFVSAADVRWLVALTAPRVKALLAYYDRKLELDAPLLTRSRAVLTRALRDGRHRTRTELADALARGGIEAAGQRLAHIVMHAEQDGLVCSGAMRGKQQTYALLEERVPPAKPRGHDEALAELTLRFFTSRGPATAKDLAVWSSLRLQDVKRGLEMVGDRLVREVVGERTYIFAPTSVRALRTPRARTGTPGVPLLQGYDEYVMAYSKSKDVLLDDAPLAPRAPRATAAASAKDTVPFLHAVIVDGRLAGHWQRTLGKAAIDVAVRLFRKLDARTTKALERAAQDYGRFAGTPASLTIE